jgi:hypothetical protein
MLVEGVATLGTWEDVIYLVSFSPTLIADITITCKN